MPILSEQQADTIVDRIKHARGNRGMTVTVWTLTQATSDITLPPRSPTPQVFASRAMADFAAATKVKDEWEARGPETMTGDRKPYPVEWHWQEAQKVLAHINPAIGRWQVDGPFELTVQIDGRA